MIKEASNIAREFAECIKNPESSLIPEMYQDLLIRDILNLSSEEIETMELDTYLHVLNYCWATYCLRRSDLPFQSKDGFQGNVGINGRMTSSKTFLRKTYSQKEINNWVKEQEVPKYIKKG